MRRESVTECDRAPEREQVPANGQGNGALGEETRYQRDRQKGLLWPLCFITSTN